MRRAGTRRVERCRGRRVQVTRGEGVARRDVREADEGVHEGELSRVIELESWHAFASGQACRFGELPQLGGQTVGECLQANGSLHVRKALDS